MKNNLIVALIMLFAATSFGQYFATPVEGFSKKKPSYVTLKTGEELVGTIKDLDFKRGLIDEITLVVGKKDKRKLTPDMIAHAYLPESGLNKMGKALDFAYDATQWGSDDINQEYMTDGYAYFEQSTVRLKKKNIEALLQMVNPAFNNPVKIFHDPWAKESASVGVGGITVAGGLEKSYWVIIGDDPAFKIKKKEYEDSISKIFSTCPDYASKLGDGPKWADFPEALFNYSKACKK